MANMERKMIRIDADRCDGCGLCAQHAMLMNF